MIINTQKVKQYDYQVDYDKPIYSLFIKPYSFMACLDKPYVNRHNQLTYSVKAISFIKPIQHEMKHLYLASLEKDSMVLRYLFVFKGSRAFDTDFGGNICINDERGNYFVCLNVIQFADWIRHNEEDIKNFVIIFNDFDDWSEIKKHVFGFGRIHLEGSDSSIRHIFSDISIRLASHLALLSNNDMGKLEDLIVKDKSILKPKHDLVNIDADFIKKEKTGSVFFFNNVYNKYKQYAINMVKPRSSYTTLSQDLYNKIEFVPLNEYISPALRKQQDKTRSAMQVNNTNLSNNVTSTLVHRCSPNNHNLKPVDIKRKYHMSTRYRGFSVMQKCGFADLSGLSAQASEGKVKGVNKSFKYDSPLYQNLNILMKDNPINAETQQKIEKFLFDYSYICLDNKAINKPFSGIDYSIINSRLAKLLLESKQSLIKIISNYKQTISKPTKQNHMDKVFIEGVNILSDIEDEYLVNIIYGRILKILSTYNRSQDSLNSIVDVGYDLGRDLINNYYFYAYLRAKSNVNKETYYLSDWKRDNPTVVAKYEDITFIFNLGSVLVGWALTCGLLEIKTVSLGYKEKANIVLPTSKLKETISNNLVFNLPKRIPMIVQPKLYSDKSLGGYLLNDVLSTDSLLKNNRNNKLHTIIRDDNVIYDLVNNISSVGYKINKDVLDFLLYYRQDYFKDDLVDINYIHPLLEKTKLSKREKTELDSYLSKKELEENILGLASVYSHIPCFYIPVNLDFRGRLNCIPEFLNYQSNELAKSLLLFSKAEKIDKTDKGSIDYLKLFGATSFGLDKKSVEDRLQWVESNIYDIVNFRNGELIIKAKNKYLFLAFCFEYNRWLDCLENHEISHFDTYLPIQLDATCNGFQHLSLLSLDPKLATEVNLSQSSWKDKPKDFYSFLVSNLMDHFKTELENNKQLALNTREGYKRLINFNLQRYIIKKSIMTIPYNVSTFQLINYIIENFRRLDNSEWFYTEDEKLKLKYSDFALLGNGLRQVLDYKFPKLNLLLSYLDNLAKVCTILEIPILWTLPSGLEVKQSYITEDEIRIKPFFYIKKTFVLKVPNKSKYNNAKQVRAFMPNLVHSLDAASLALLLDFYFQGTKDIKNIYTVHDCFAVTANNVSNLLDLLKLTYVKIYSNDTYLRKLDKGIIDNIKNVYGEHSFNDKTRIIHLSTNNTDIPFPDIEVVLGKKVKLDFDSLQKSQYILN